MLGTVASDWGLQLIVTFSYMTTDRESGLRDQHVEKL